MSQVIDACRAFAVRDSVNPGEEAGRRSPLRCDNAYVEGTCVRRRPVIVANAFLRTVIVTGANPGAAGRRDTTVPDEGTAEKIGQVVLLSPAP